jgi:hypothetical protein
MAREPSYPEEAGVGEPASPPPEQPEAASEKPRVGEAAQAAAAAKESDPRRTRHLVAGAAIGIGSAALVAALLYANRSRKGDRGEG